MFLFSAATGYYTRIPVIECYGHVTSMTGVDPDFETTS
jgi:hypothetical protein